MSNPLSDEENTIFNAISATQSSLQDVKSTFAERKRRLEEVEKDLRIQQQWYQETLNRKNALEQRLLDYKERLQKLWGQPTVVLLKTADGKSSLEIDSLASLETRSENTDAGPGWA